MTDVGHPGGAGFWQRLADRVLDWSTDRVASPDFQKWAAGFWLTRPFVRRDSAKVYDLVAGFVYSQTLLACVELGVLHTLKRGAASADALALAHGLSPDRAARLAQAAAATGLLVRQRDGRYRLGRLGAAVLGVPGLEDMIRHHRVFYRDLADPVGLLKGEAETELSQFWPYVFGTAETVDPDRAATYSDLMATSQHLVAEETLDAVPLRGISRLMDVGGGTGVFLDHVARRAPGLDLTLFDLPSVVEAAEVRTGGAAPFASRGGSFRDDPLPEGHDAISLIRVLYDHDEDVVRALLTKVHATLPPGGRIIVSEPMSGGEMPCRAGDAYFGFYTLAMTTGRPRSPEHHIALLREAGFGETRVRATGRPFLTRVVTARKAST